MATETETKTDALTTRQVAEALGTDPRTLRKFLRSQERGVGAGSRYEFKQGDIADLKKGFAAWSTKEKKARDENKADLTPTEKPTDLDQMTVAQLKRLAQQHDIPLPSKMKRAEMIDHLRGRLTA